MSNPDDEVIIDLTDLMDEEEPDKMVPPIKDKIEDKPLKLETETFDLGKELSLDDSQTIPNNDKLDFDRIFRESINNITTSKPAEPIKQVSELDEPFSMDTKLNEEPASFIAPDINLQQTPADETPAQEEATPVFNSPDSATITQAVMNELPAMVESIAKQLVSDIASEIVSSMKRELPDIIEKVVQEEIEKLKKID